MYWLCNALNYLYFCENTPGLQEPRCRSSEQTGGDDRRRGSETAQQGQLVELSGIQMSVDPAVVCLFVCL